MSLLYGFLSETIYAGTFIMRVVLQDLFIPSGNVFTSRKHADKNTCWDVLVLRNGLSFKFVLWHFVRETY